jgi:hypothetical protein
MKEVMEQRAVSDKVVRWTIHPGSADKGWPTPSPPTESSSASSPARQVSRVCEHQQLEQHEDIPSLLHGRVLDEQTCA